MLADQNLEIKDSPPQILTEKLLKLTSQNEVKSLAIFQSVATSISSATDTDSSDDVPKKYVRCGAVIVTTEAIHLTTNFQWLCDNLNDKTVNDAVTTTQPMTNLVELDKVTQTQESCSFTLSFMDELENTIEKWRFQFESDSFPRVSKLLTEVDTIWQKIFCVPLITDQMS